MKIFYLKSSFVALVDIMETLTAIPAETFYKLMNKGRRIISWRNGRTNSLSRHKAIIENKVNC